LWIIGADLNYNDHEEENVYSVYSESTFFEKINPLTPTNTINNNINLTRSPMNKQQTTATTGENEDHDHKNDIIIADKLPTTTDSTVIANDLTDTHNTITSMMETTTATNNKLLSIELEEIPLMNPWDTVQSPSPPIYHPSAFNVFQTTNKEENTHYFFSNSIPIEESLLVVGSNEEEEASSVSEEREEEKRETVQTTTCNTIPNVPNTTTTSPPPSPHYYPHNTDTSSPSRVLNLTAGEKAVTNTNQNNNNKYHNNQWFEKSQRIPMRLEPKVSKVTENIRGINMSQDDNPVVTRKQQRLSRQPYNTTTTTSATTTNNIGDEENIALTTHKSFRSSFRSPTARLKLISPKTS